MRLNQFRKFQNGCVGEYQGNGKWACFKDDGELLAVFYLANAENIYGESKIIPSLPF